MVTPHPRRWWILGVLCLSLLVLSVDAMILNLAIPSLMRDLSATSADVQWILDGYLLTFAGSLITAGALSDRYGRRKMLVIGLGILGSTSLLAAFASEPWQVIACRALMGVGAACAMPSTLSIVMTVFDAEERRKAMSVWGMVGMVGVVAGPTLGGLLLQHYWWGSAFLINVPIAAVGIVAALVLIPESRGPARPADPLGVVLSMAGMASVVWAIISLPQDGLSGRVLVALVAGLAIMAGFLVWESRSKHPMLPLALFRNRDFTGASLSVVLLMLATGALLLALTQYLQLVLGYGPAKAGLALAPFAVVSAVTNMLSATLGKRISNKTLIIAGMLVIGAGFALLATIGPNDGYPLLIAGLVVMGVGAGIATPAIYASLMGAIPPEHAGVGSAVNDTIQQTGQVLSVAALGSALSAGYTHALPAGLPAAARSSVEATLKLAAATGSKSLEHTAKAAFTSSMSTVFIAGLIGALASATFALVVLRRRPVPPSAPAEPEPEPDTVEKLAA